jgi:uncharacterized membrane protein YsdA (DUF1294 family)
MRRGRCARAAKEGKHRQMEISHALKVAFWVYLAAVNGFGFAQMGWDKRLARRHAWRIPERRLFAAALLGGSLGCIAGMWVFRHKTKHWYFVAGMPLILALQLAAAWMAVQHWPRLIA